MLIKICGITNLEDALAAIEAGADALGFNFYRRSPRYLAPQDAQRIIAALPATVMSVGVFVNEDSAEQVAVVMDSVGLTAAQLHGDESPEFCAALRGRYIIKALRAHEHFDPQVVKNFDTDAILLDAYVKDARGGTGRTVDWDVAKSVGQLVPELFLAGGLSPENVSEAVALVKPYAVDACSHLESAPGKKDHERMRSFIKAARRAS